jgi:eukaryotic-like serine/threonine-protein kinase
MPLTLQQLRALDVLVQTGLDQPEAQRRAWFDSLAVDEPALKALLESALFPDRTIETASFLDRPPEIDDPERTQSADLEIGQMVGTYTLITPLGEGGSASVWRAQRSDGALKREIALKLPYFVGNTRGWHERVTRERDILASLNHPNIASIYDAGIEANGRPWLALELIDGAHIDAYCKQHVLSVDQRVALLVRVARAVEYAHARGVIHRDLKPGNILVDDSGQVKLLDFGIAKLFDANDSTSTSDTTMLTRLHGRPFTPEYASPEQKRGEAITTGVDVYALGTVLYELIVGARPERSDDNAPRIDLRAALKQKKPDAASGSIRNDLNAIIQKAVHVDLAKRYVTVNAFADDLERYRKNEAVMAQPDSGWYRFTRLVRRNRVAVAATTAVTISLVVGSAIALWQASEARSQRIAAEAEGEKAKAVSSFLTKLFEVNREDQQAAIQKRKQPIESVLAEAASTLPTAFVNQPLVRAELLRVVGDVLFGLSMGEQALTTRKAQLEVLTGAAAARAEIERARLELAMVEIDSGDWKSGRARLELVATTLNTPANRAERIQLADALSVLGQMKAYSFDAKGALELLNASIAHVERADDGSGTLLAEPLIARASANSDLGNADAVERDMQRAINITERVHGKASLKTVAAHYRNYEAQITLDNTAAALDAARKAFGIVEGMQLQETFWGARSRMAIGRALIATGAPLKAIAPLQAAIETIDKVTGDLDPDGQIVTRAYAGEAAFWTGDIARSAQILDKADTILRDQSERLGGLVAPVSAARAKIPLLLARRESQKAITLAQDTLKALDEAGGYSPEIAVFTAFQAVAQAQQGKSSEAIQTVKAFEGRQRRISLTESTSLMLAAAFARARTGSDMAQTTAAWTDGDEALLKKLMVRSARINRPFVHADALDALAALAGKAQQPDKAKAAWIYALEILENHEAANSFNATRVRDQLATLQRQSRQ